MRPLKPSRDSPLLKLSNISRMFSPTEDVYHIPSTTEELEELDRLLNLARLSEDGLKNQLK